MTLVEGRDLVVEYTTSRGKFRALRGVDFDLIPGDTLGVVGESGCGKSTLARCLVGLERPTAGTMLLGTDQRPLQSMSRLERARNAQLVFQDPTSSLNPRLTVGESIAQALKVHKMGGRAERGSAVRELMAAVGLPQDFYSRYPHELSGGQRQRVGIARALSLRPPLIICDEPVSALDVSVQAQVLNVLLDLQNKLNISYLFISHDLSVIRYMSHRVAVMYLGRVVETGTTDTVWRHRLHPYTRALIAAIPGEADSGVPALRGELPSPMNPPSGCAFRTRCPLATSICAEQDPVLRSVGHGHAVACHMVAADTMLSPTIRPSAKCSTAG